MKVNGIIAEYNPFHNGHKYQLEESLRLTGADYTVVVMSGNFVQRGAPALLDKHTRAEMALRGGADLVLELPTLCAVSSAEYFAAGAVALLDKLGIITHLCFGSECGETEPLRRIALRLSDQHGEYDAALRRRLKEGLSYPQARA
ncbi:MAG: nucleotidyltransferase family protein, partial [Lachnospiraceae bacterium]|nr:nucleotidyltransferase family protein [Lachnospiraceae bacterium]